MMRIEKDKVVALRYIMRNSREEILEGTMNGKPIIYLHGTSDIQQLLQQQLEGLYPGAWKILYLPKSSGLIPGDFSFEVVIDDVRDASSEELMLGYPLQLSVKKCEEDCNCYAAQK